MLQFNYVKRQYNKGEEGQEEGGAGGSLAVLSAMRRGGRGKMGDTRATLCVREDYHAVVLMSARRCPHGVPARNQAPTVPPRKE
eukprot:scaffold19707_cov33-Tisochrysis_lutea.AAC.3